MRTQFVYPSWHISRQYFFHFTLHVFVLLETIIRDQLLKISKLSRIIAILAYSWANRTQLIYIFLFNPDPEWSEWSSYGPCSSTCGQGFQTRRRTCLKSFGTQDCQGKFSESKGCNSQLCVKGGCWSILNCEFNIN